MSLYAALAIAFDFFLQITCFLAVFTLDIRRQVASFPCLLLKFYRLAAVLQWALSKL